MLRVILVLVAVTALLALAAWITPDGLINDLLRISVAVVVLILFFGASIGFLQWLSPTNPDGSPRT